MFKKIFIGVSLYCSLSAMAGETIWFAKTNDIGAGITERILKNAGYTIKDVNTHDREDGIYLWSMSRKTYSKDGTLGAWDSLLGSSYFCRVGNQNILLQGEVTTSLSTNSNVTVLIAKKEIEHVHSVATKDMILRLKSSTIDEQRNMCSNLKNGSKLGL